MLKKIVVLVKSLFTVALLGSCIMLASAASFNFSSPVLLSVDSAQSIPVLSKGDSYYYTFTLPKNALGLSVTLTGTNGDADIYLNKDKIRTSKTSTWRSAKSSSNEKISIARPVSGTYYLTLIGYETASNLTLTLKYTDAATGAQTLVKQVPVTVATMGQDEEKLFTFTLPSSSPNLTITTTGTEGDIDIYLNKDTIRSTKLSTWKSTGDASDERITVATAQAGTYYLSLRAYTPTTNTVVTMDYGTTVTPTPVVTNGSCGASANQTLSSVPTSLCNAGSASSVTTTDSSYIWSCTGSNGGTTASCTSSKTVVTPTPVAVNGSCGTSANKTLSSVPTSNLCTTGTASSVTSGTNYSWSCTGSNGGTTASCTSSKTGVVTPVNYTLTTSATNGTITSGGTYASGTSVTLTATPATGYTFSSFTGCTSTSANTCTVLMTGNKTVSASFTITPVAVNGSCGTSANQTLSALPTSNLCSTGTASSVSNTDMYMWTCAGSNGGVTASCHASKTAVTTPPTGTLTAGPGVDGPIPNVYNPTYSFCSALFYGGCSFTGLRTIRYGNGTKWFYKEGIERFSGSACHPDNFGVPSSQFEPTKDHCEVADTYKTGTLKAPVTSQHGGTYPTVDLTKIPLGLKGQSSIMIASSTDLGDPSDIGAFRIPCRYAKMAFNDPIVYPGQSGKSHLHTFFGNVDVNANSTVDSIANSGNSTCAGGIANRSSYWVPSLINTRTGEPLVPTTALWYYKTGYEGVAPSAVKRVPSGLRMISGDMHATSSQYGLSWECSTSYLTRKSTIPTDCPVGNYILMSVHFPQCWDGKNLDSPDHKSHMAFGLGGTKGCPATHPVPLPVISLNIHYDVTAENVNDVKNWRLSSDHDGNPSGLSIHGDFFEGWNKTVAQTFVDNCLVKSKDCHGYLLGNGTMLLENQ